MSFNGYLLKVGTTTFPLSYVYKESYSVTPNRRMDLDSYRDANGELHRTVLDHAPSTISFKTKPMTNTDLATMMTLIRDNYVNTNEKKVSLEYYCPDLDAYQTGVFYIPDVEYPIYSVDLNKNKIIYKSFDLEFIEY